MIDGNAVVAQARQGNVPPSWQVLRAKASFFYQQAGVGGLLLVVGAGGFLYLMSNPNMAIEPGVGSGTDTASGIGLWRNIDFAILAVFALVGIYVLVKSLADSANASQQLLVLMPEGFVISTNKMQTYEYSTIRNIAITLNRGTASIKLTPVSGASAIRVQLDGRFGTTKQIAQNILTARQRFAAAPVAPQQPPVNR
jgi:hypothetical protein